MRKYDSQNLRLGKNEKIEFFRLCDLLPDQEINEKLEAYLIYSFDVNAKTRDMVLRIAPREEHQEGLSFELMLLTSDGRISHDGPIMDSTRHDDPLIGRGFVINNKEGQVMKLEKISGDKHRVSIYFEKIGGEQSPIIDEVPCEKLKFSFIAGIALLLYKNVASGRRELWIRSISMKKAIKITLDDSFIVVDQVGNGQVAIIFQRVVTLIDTRNGDKDFFPVKSGFKLRKACLMRMKLYIFECTQDKSEKVVLLSWDSTAPEEPMKKIELPFGCVRSSAFAPRDNAYETAFMLPTKKGLRMFCLK